MMTCCTLRYNSTEKTLCTRHRQERRDTKGPSRLTKDSHIVRITTESCDVLLYPCECCDLVEQAKVGNTVIQIEKAISAEAIVDGNTYHSITGEATTVILWYCT